MRVCSDYKKNQPVEKQPIIELLTFDPIFAMKICMICHSSASFILCLLQQSIQTMRGDSQPLKRPSRKSQNLHPRKNQKYSSNLFPCSIQEFQFNLPSYSMPITIRNSITTADHKDPKEQPSMQPIEDYRRQSIKQKIKFRVKQEMWNLIKKNYEKPAIIGPPLFLDAKTQPNPQTIVPFVKGSSLTRASRDNITLRKTDLSQRKMLSRSYYKQNAKQGQPKHKRVWSSFVKMKEKDRMEMQKSKYRASVSSINIEKLDSYKIQPWKGFDDHENLLEER